MGELEKRNRDGVSIPFFCVKWGGKGGGGGHVAQNYFVQHADGRF